MHQIRFWLGLRPRPRWGSSQRFRRLASWILGGLTSEERERREKWRAREGRGKVNKRGKRQERKEQKGRRGKGRRAPQLKFLATPLDTALSGVV